MHIAQAFAPPVHTHTFIWALHKRLHTPRTNTRIHVCTHTLYPSTRTCAHCTSICTPLCAHTCMQRLKPHCSCFLGLPFSGARGGCRPPVMPTQHFAPKRRAGRWASGAQTPPLLHEAGTWPNCQMLAPRSPGCVSAGSSISLGKPQQKPSWGLEVWKNLLEGAKVLVAWVISSHCLHALCDKDTSLSSPGQRHARSLCCANVCVNPAPAAGEDVKMHKMPF